MGEICFWKCPVLDVSGLRRFYYILNFVKDFWLKCLRFWYFNWKLKFNSLGNFWILFNFLILLSRARLPLLLGTLRMAGPQECPLTPCPLSWCQIVTRHHDTNRQRATLCDVPRPSWRRHWGPHSARLWEPSRAWNLSRFKKLKCYFSFCRDTYFENFHVLHFI